MNHTPVLFHEVMNAIKPHSPGLFIDATVGDGGHAGVILALAQPQGRLLALDQDPAQVKVAQAALAHYGDRATVVESRFSQLKAVATKHGFAQVDGILFDLGISSRQLDEPHYGLTFADEGNLDMRLSPSLTDSAATLLNHANETELADLLYFYADRHNSRWLARKLVVYRRKHPFATAADVKAALNLHRPADLAPIFQALRIAVNLEYDELEMALPQAVELLKPGGVLAVITFHSGEDKIVKRFLRQQQSEGQLTKGTKVQPSYAEIKTNSRARSALLRTAIKR